jgi:hypothetical protein
MEIVIALAIVAVAATIVATVRVSVTDGYRRVPTHRNAH